MGKLNIQGDLDIYNYLTAANTNLYLSSASTSYSIRFRAGTTEFLRGQISTSTNGTTHGTITGLYLIGPTYGNTTANIATAGKLSIGDPGPQIIFNSYASLSDGQPLALIYSDNDSIASGNSLSLVSSESNCTFIAPTIKALTKFIGTLNGNASTATKLKTARTISLTGSVTGSGSFDGSGNLSIATTTNHSHSYLPLSGGTMNNGAQIVRNGVSSSWYNGRDKAMIRQKTIDGYSPIMSIKSTNGTWEMGCYDNSSYLDRFILGYKADKEYSAGTPNSIVHAFNLTKEGNAIFAGSVTATSFSGTIAWGNVTSKPSSYTPAAHTNHATLTITSKSASAHLAFSRANLNYVTCPASGYLGFSMNGQGTSLAVCDLVVADGSVYPGSNNATTLGSSSYRWSTVHTQRLIAYNTTDAGATAKNAVALITGDPSGQHIEFDGNEIISKTNATTGGVLYINSGGAYTQLYTIGGEKGQTYGPSLPTAYTTGQIFFKI